MATFLPAFTITALTGPLFFAIFSRTDLRISESGAKFDADVDFDVRLAVVPPKPWQINEKLIYETKKV